MPPRTEKIEETKKNTKEKFINDRRERETWLGGGRMEINGICCVKTSGGFLPSDFDGSVIAVRKGIIVFMKENKVGCKHLLKLWGIAPREHGVDRIPLIEAEIGKLEDNVGIIATFTRRYYDGIHVAIEGYDANSGVAYRFAINPDALKLVDADKLFMIINDFVKRAGAEKAIVEKVLEALVEYAINAINVGDIEGCMAARIPKRIINLNPLWVLCEAVRLARLMA